MKILTIGDNCYKDFIDVNISQFKKFGYDYVVYDLGGLGYGRKYKAKDGDFNVDKELGIKRISCKPDIIRKEIEYNELLVFLDGDTYIVNRIDDVFEDDFDIGVTIREKIERDILWKRDDYMSPVNSGVMFFKRTKETIDFIDKWIETCNEMNGVEQASLNYLIQEYCRGKVEGDIIEIGKLKIKLFSGVMYNNYYFDEWLDPIIYHFKGALKINYLDRTNKFEKKRVIDNKVDRAIKYLLDNGVFKKNKYYKRYELFLDSNRKKI